MQSSKNLGMYQPASPGLPRFRCRLPSWVFLEFINWGFGVNTQLMSIDFFQLAMYFEVWCFTLLLSAAVSVAYSVLTVGISKADVYRKNLCLICLAVLIFVPLSLVEVIYWQMGCPYWETDNLWGALPLGPILPSGCARSWTSPREQLCWNRSTAYAMRNYSAGRGLAEFGL